MKCVIITTTADSGLAVATQSTISKLVSPALAPLVDRPFCQHVVEHIVRTGITEIDFIVGDNEVAVRELFDSGERWGAHFEYHRLDDPARPFDVVKNLDVANGDEAFVLVHADQIPFTNLSRLCQSRQDSSVWDQQTKQWTGWATVTPECIQAVPPGLTANAFGDFLAAISNDSQQTQAETVLDARTKAEFLTAQTDVLTSNWTLYGREQRSGIRLCRNVRIDKTAELIGPVFLGDNVWIGPHVTIGPYSIISADCVVDRSTRIARSLIFSNTIVGEHLSIADSIVAQNRLFNVRLDAELNVDDSLVLK